MRRFGSLTVGSVCSGIEACSVAVKGLDYSVRWVSEIAKFQSKVLNFKYPGVPNLGDMNEIPGKILRGEVASPDVICGGTPCQAFSLAGLKKGLEDARGNLTLKFVEIVDANDKVRAGQGKSRSIVLWENVEGVLRDKTNAFGCFLASLAGADEAFECRRWAAAGLVRGPVRNVAWRVLDAKYFGLPQQRRRLYVVATGKDQNPEEILFETLEGEAEMSEMPKRLAFEKDGHRYEVFREYTDCLYSSYGTKWNGNAAALNGSLFVVQDERLRRLSPLECERLMGFPDNYTNIPGAKKTNRYQALGNSWAVPVIAWIAERILNKAVDSFAFSGEEAGALAAVQNGAEVFALSDTVETERARFNCSAKPNHPHFSSLKNIIDGEPPEDIYISSVGCYGILRRKTERNMRINARLEKVLSGIASKMPLEEIERRSRVQKRGAFSRLKEKAAVVDNQLSLF